MSSSRLAAVLLAASLVTAAPAVAQQPDLDTVLQRGAAAVDSGDLAVAEAEFRQALALSPGHPFASAMLGTVLLARGAADEALPLLELATREAPELDVAWVGLAQARLAAGSVDESIEPLRNALRLRPEDHALRLQLAQALRQAGRTDEALSVAMDAVEEEPDNALAARLRITLLVELGRNTEALDGLAEFLQSHPDDRAALVLYGDLLTRSGFGLDGSVAAAAAWRQALAMQPDDLDLVRRLVPLYSELGLYEEALQFLEAAGAPARRNADLLIARGRLLSQMQRYAAALEEYQRAVQLGAIAQGWYQSGIAQANLGDLDAAVEAFQRAIDADPSMGAGFRELGKVMSDRGRYDEAATALARAVDLLPDDPTAHALAGAAELRAGRPEAALPLLDRATELAPADPQPLYDRAIALRQLGRTEESRAAMEVFRQAESRADATGDSQQVLRTRARGMVQQGMTRLRLVSAEAALPYFDQAIELDAELAVAWYGKGLCHARQGQWPDAAAAFERNVALDPDRPDGYAGLAEAYARLGRRGDAERMRVRAAELLARLRQQ